MSHISRIPKWLPPLLVMLYFGAATSLLPPVLFFEQGSDELIVDSLADSIRQNEPSPFMSRVHPLAEGKSTPYYSQFGLTYRVLLPFRDYLPRTGLQFLLSLAWALATGAMFWWFQRLVADLHGSTSGLVFLLLCCATPTFLFFSASLYWQLPLLLLPFMLTYAFVIERPIFTASCISLLLFLRFLGGYEYTSTLILSPIAALGLRCSYGDIAPRRAFQLAVRLGAAGFIAFLAAMLLHLTTLAHAAGGWEEGVARFREVAESRTSGDFLGRQPTLKNDVIHLISSFFRNEVILVLGLAAVTLLLTATLVDRRATIKLATALLFAFLCSLSWQLLARGHMRDHAHINFIVYLIPFGLSVYLAFSRLIGDLAKSRLA